MTSLAEYVPTVIQPYIETVFLLVLLRLFFLYIGLVWFGILNLRQPVIRRWKWMPLATGLMGANGFFRTLFAMGLALFL